jgi:gamma-glutamylcyclotransferase
MSLYFAYGSNLDWDRMKDRCPQSVKLYRAVLRDHCLAFTRTSTKGHGVADIVESQGENTWGVVYEVPEDNLPKLNKCEGYKSNRLKYENSYNPEFIVVYIENEHARPVRVIAYKAIETPGPHVPNREYLNHIICGARHWGLPAEYVEMLKAIETSD